ncbi:MAG: gamma-glutamyltransferase [Clostridiales bacterium]|nr:gamma-glutamyltransferase [Clostridiales bacterium]
MEKKKVQQKKKNNKGLVAFTAIALVLAIALGAIVYLPKLLKKNNDPIEVLTTSTPSPIPTDSQGVPIVTAAPTDIDVTPTEEVTVVAKNNYAVSCSNPYVTAIGMNILENGGNAVDAIVAMSFALGVLEPYASGVGGGGGMLVYDPATGESTFYDYRDAACSNINTPLGKVGLPGFVLGMETVSKNHGKLDWGSLIQPAIEYAENGFAISPSFARHLQSSRSKLSSKRNPQFFNGSRLLVEGETIYQLDLADTYRKIQRYGSTVFYHGAIAEHIIANTKLEQQDFDMYQVQVRTPVTGTYLGNTIVSAPAPFSGTTLIQMLSIAEKINYTDYDDDVVAYAKVMASLSTVTLKDRLKSICDPAYHTVPANLLSEDHINKLLEKVKAGAVEYIDEDPEHTSTTHISVIDANGMMASATNTLSDFFGIGVYVDGFFMNDTMVTSSKETIARNYCQRGQRPRSFAMPTFIFCQDGSKLVLGSSGGDRIPQTVMQIIVRYFQGESLQEACDRPRLFIQGYIYRIEDSKTIDPEGKISKSGFYNVGFSSNEFFGAFNAVGVDKDGKAFGASDGRRYGSFSSADGENIPDEENDG